MIYFFHPFFFLEKFIKTYDFLEIIKKHLPLHKVPLNIYQYDHLE
jgi:hypothetical protein